MPTHRPLFPDLLFEPARRLRVWEARLMALFADAGYAELRPSLVSRKLTTGTHATLGREKLVLDGEGGVSALRSDFTLALADLLVVRYADPPRRVSYAGPVFREPEGAWEPTERFEVGCEHTQPHDDGEDADRALCTLLARVPEALGLSGGTMKLGHADLVRRPLADEGVSGARRDAYVRALSVRALHAVPAAVEGLGDGPEARLLAHARALLDDAPEVSPYASLVRDDLEAIERAASVFREALPATVSVRRDYADVTGIDFYTGPTFALWAPFATAELAAGGRYDALYPQLGKPWRAAGFCVRLSRVLDLHEAHPELFTRGDA